ncbi:MAG: NusA-like transcription termination signal-binding factor [Candidatus Thermoplasmatota archaeon]|jgi:N utilization substance protein A|nr:NusA-like transcription termination signal-binding factor [Candidatus Thermoplasmatota archaeon]
MKEITIDNKIMGYITLFEKVAHVEVKECVENEDMILFIVGERKLQEIFKRNENAIPVIRERTNKHVLIAEQSRDLITFVRNIFFRFGVREIIINWKEGQTDVLVGVNQTDVGKAIGKEGRNIKLFREAIVRSFNVRSVNIKQ